MYNKTRWEAVTIGKTTVLVYNTFGMHVKSRISLMIYNICQHSAVHWNLRVKSMLVQKHIKVLELLVLYLSHFRYETDRCSIPRMYCLFRHRSDLLALTSNLAIKCIILVQKQIYTLTHSLCCWYTVLLTQSAQPAVCSLELNLAAKNLNPAKSG